MLLALQLLRKTRKSPGAIRQVVAGRFGMPDGIPQDLLKKANALCVAFSEEGSHWLWWQLWPRRDDMAVPARITPSVEPARWMALQGGSWGVAIGWHRDGLHPAHDEVLAAPIPCLRTK